MSGVYKGDMMMIEKLDDFNLAVGTMVVDVAGAGVFPDVRISRMYCNLEIVPMRVVQVMDADRRMIDVQVVGVQGCRRCEVGDLVGVGGGHVGRGEPEIIGLLAASQCIVSAKAEKVIPIVTAMDDVVAA